MYLSSTFNYTMSSNSVSKRMRRMRTETNTGVLNTLIHVFHEDILPQIFDNTEILTVKDLLNFRLVNRSWRDAATSVLLKRNLCEIALKFGKVFFDEDGNKVTGPELWKIQMQYTPSSILPFNNFFNAYQPKSFLSDLNQLISTSPKFPSTSIRFREECGSALGNLCQTLELPDEDHPQKDLFQFLSAYGKNGVVTHEFRNIFKLKVLRTSSFYHKCYQYRAVQLWNKVPVDIHKQKTLKDFQFELGKWILSKRDNIYV